MSSEPGHVWFRRRTQYFGDVWTPLITTELRSISGRYVPFVLQIDSGAVISLLERSAGSILGLNVESGRRIILSSVGGSETVAWVHEIPMRISEGLEIVVPFAVADSESVPPLLGWTGVFDKLRICFDPVMHCCTFELP